MYLVNFTAICFNYNIFKIGKMLEIILQYLNFDILKE